MTALVKDRNTPRRAGDQFDDPVAAATVLFEGAMVCLNAAGDAVPGSTATGLVPRGVAEARVDNAAGAVGDKSVPSQAGTFRFENSTAADEITRAEIGDTAYIVDDQTVAKTDGTGTRSAAGKIIDVDAVGVWVAFG